MDGDKSKNDQQAAGLAEPKTGTRPLLRAKTSIPRGHEAVKRFYVHLQSSCRIETSERLLRRFSCRSPLA